MLLPVFFHVTLNTFLYYSGNGLAVKIKGTLTAKFWGSFLSVMFCLKWTEITEMSNMSQQQMMETTF